MMQKINNAGIDEVADDKHALNEQQREEKEAQIMADALLIERSECALIWAAESKGEVLDFRGDTTVQAVLGLTLVQRPRANPSGTSPEHAFNIIGARR
ncbi:hypothetical protein [Bradyrhizobium sp. RDI18]|uniref:hypothetical protein n=1 Tax=Bradyrhizobium sp. RDI18 TaxID=3367400 RepID=UPI0037153A86